MAQADRHRSSFYGTILDVPEPLSKLFSTEAAHRLLELVAQLDVPIEFERSFKMSKNTLLPDRFLMGASLAKIHGASGCSVEDVCTAMKMPKPFLTVFSEHLPDTDYVHFGFEKGPSASVYKVYQEFYEKMKNGLQMDPAPHEPQTLHLGYKWNVADRRKRVLSRYMWYPGLRPDALFRRLVDLLSSSTISVFSGMVRGIASLALTRMSAGDALYLEVSEESNPRRSFDINLYAAGLCVGELYPFLHQFCRIFNIPLQTFHRFYDGIKERTVGHLSGGIDRKGNDFLTVYYGVDDLSAAVGYGAPGIRSRERKSDTAAARPPEPARADWSDPRAGRIVEMVNRLNVPTGFEHSFKMLPGQILDDRFLMGVEKISLGPGADDKIVDICRAVHMPEDLLGRFCRELPRATIILFGYEGSPAGSVLKVYLEFGGRLSDTTSNTTARRGGVLIHRGFKWDPDQPQRKTIAHYRCFPRYRLEDVLGMLARLHPTQEQNEAFLITDGIIRLCASQGGPGSFLYFEVSEDGNVRQSFDINLYRANFRLGELYPVLLRMCRYYGIGLERFHRCYEPMKHFFFGHLTAGIDRKGRPFHTIYYGEKGSSR